MSDNGGYVLEHYLCSTCVWGEKGHYNFMCAHCPYCSYSKSKEPKHMTRDMAEMLELVRKD